MEIWKDIEGYKGLYKVSNLGRVKSLKFGREKILKAGKNNRGYLTVNLFKDEKKKSYKIHRLVAQTFIPNPENKPYIDHINTIKTDNRVENLRWCTQKENMNNPLTKKKIESKIISEETKKKISNSTTGGKNPKAKKTFCGGIIFSCGKECAEYYGENPNTMICWLNGKNPMPKKFKELGLKYVS